MYKAVLLSPLGRVHPIQCFCLLLEQYMISVCFLVQNRNQTLSELTNLNLAMHYSFTGFNLIKPTQEYNGPAI